MNINFTTKGRAIAVLHLAASIFVASSYHGFFSGTPERYIWFEAWNNFFVTVLIILQPLIMLLFKTDALSLIPGWSSLLLGLSLFVAWSCFFGWLYVKFTNWLNHFPILGKKVF